jgi:hypothetical protein
VAVAGSGPEPGVGRPGKEKQEDVDWRGSPQRVERDVAISGVDAEQDDQPGASTFSVLGQTCGANQQFSAANIAATPPA